MQQNKVITFITEHFSKQDALEIIELLESCHLLGLCDRTVGILKDKAIVKDEVIIANIASGMLTSMYYKASKITDASKQHFALNNFARLTERLLIMLVSENIENSELIFKTLDKSLQITCMQYGYDFRMLTQFFDFEKIKYVVDTMKAQKAEPITTAKVSKKQRYTWLQNGNLSLLVDALYRDNFIKNKRDFFDLFLKPKEDSKVKWNEERKQHLAYLLYRLFNSNYAKIEGTKGYFAYAEKHFVTYEEECFVANSLKKTSSHISLFPQEYKTVINDIEVMLEHI